jgi:Zn2+/Cd2+-exporting ATPase
MASKTYIVTGMDCADCARSVERGVKRLESVNTVRVDFGTSKMHVDGEVTQEVLRQRVEKLGYGLADETALKSEKKSRGGVIGFWDYLNSRRETRLALGGGFLALIGFVASLLGLPENISALVFIAAMAITAYPIARSGISTLLVNREFNINLLMTIAAIGAVIINEPFEAATVIFLFAIGEALEGYTADRARDSLRSLMELAPAQAHVDGQVIPVELLRVNDVILVKPGERIPMDGVIVEGESDVNQAPITGESIPVQKGKDADVFAGTINGSGALKISVTHLAADNTLSRIIRMVEEAQSVRAPSQRAVDQFARIYTPAVVVIAVLVALVPPLLFNAPFYNMADGGHGWLYRALSLLVIACPCALVISAPVTVISAITAAARRGVLFKGGAHLEALGQVKAFAFDKTGTLTYGNPVVTTARSIDCATGESCAYCDDVLALAAAVESSSAHPLAKAVVGAAQERGLQMAYPHAESVEMLAGQGVRGTVTGKPVTVGSHALFDSQYPHTPEFCSLVKDAEAHGQTTMLLADGERVRGFIGVADAVREDSAKAIEELKALGLETTMLTGDNPTVASAVGQQVHVDDVRAGLLPADKVDAVKELRAKYGSVAMVGDGVNDTPALAAATVGIAMGGAGSAQALETADVALMGDDIKQLPFAVRLSRFARSLIQQNMGISFGVKVLFLILAVFFDTSLWLAIFADVGVSLIVTLNGMRPLRFE